MAEGYQKVAKLQDVPENGCLAVETGGRSLVLVRQHGRVFALENRCPHAGAPLSEGFIDGKVLTCSWHGWSFDLASGVCPDDPEAIVPSFEVKLEGDDVLVKA